MLAGSHTAKKKAQGKIDPYLSLAATQMLHLALMRDDSSQPV